MTRRGGETESPESAETIPSLRGAALRAPDASVVLQPGFVVADRYEILNELGRGGMGAVFRARQTALGRDVAVKVMLPAFAAMSDFAMRFEREARIMSGISHKNIASVFDFGRMNGVPYLVLELLDGEDLETWLQELGRLPTLAEVDEIMRQIIDAFVAAHHVHIVHRDVKPGNMFLARDTEGRRTVKVLDFGLARIDDPPGASSRVITKVEMVSGSPAYMSPEQCRSLNVGASSDLYALGCVLTELLQGSPPFDAESIAELLASHMFLAPPPIVRPVGSEAIPHALEQLRKDLLAKEPSNRPASAVELRGRWELAMHDRPRTTRDVGREARVPVWSGAEPVIVQKEEELAAPTIRLAVVRVGAGPHATDDATFARAFAAWGAQLTGPDAAEVVLLDAFDDLGEALLTLARLSTGGAPTLVAIRADDGSEIAALVAAGAADAIPYPLDLSRLLPKLVRLRTQARRRSRS